MDELFFSTFYLKKKEEQLFCSLPTTAYIQYKNFRINLLTGERKEASVDYFLREMDHYRLDQNYESPIVIHLFYELGHFVNELYDQLDETKPLGIIIHYSKVEHFPLMSQKTSETFRFKPLSKLSFELYQKKFQEVYRHLYDGDCYQINLTFPFYFRAEKAISPHDYLQHLWKKSQKVGAYAHATYIDSLGKLFLSNSPECLFQVVENKKKLWLRTMPIKGTMAIKKEKNRKQTWKKLKGSLKDQAELFMIADLLRNDLTALSSNVSNVLYKKYPLHVPGLIHQFSLIETQIDHKKTIADIIWNLFPGGSITGTPKKRVMQITDEVEGCDRGFYCGSTILLYKSVKTASINIRSIEVDYLQDEIRYGAGGGITLQSQAKEEYNEVLAKLKSFLLLLSN